MDSDTPYDEPFETTSEDSGYEEAGEFSSDTTTMVESDSESESASEQSEAAEMASPDALATDVDADSQPFVGRWNQLISSTNWEKGRIICDWRNNLHANGAPSSEYSDEAWARRVGGVTSPHVGRLRRVFEKFGSDYETYPGLYWSHFLAALDWDDAPLWLEGAVRSGWSISQMRNQRWEATGGRPEDEPKAADIIATDTDEDIIMPAQGGGKEGRSNDQPDGISAGPLPENPDFGEEEFTGEPPAAGSDANGNLNDDGNTENLDGPGSSSLVQPFAGLPDLPTDMTEALEMFKLSIIRHKASGWTEIAPETVVKVLDALKTLVASRSE